MSRSLMLLLLLSACASNPPPTDSAENQPVADPPAPTSLPKSEAPPDKTATPVSTSTNAPKPVPPLSSPNPTAKPTATSDDAGPPAGDPRTEALRRVGVIGQRCHERNTPGVSGELALEIALASDGAIQKARVIKERSTAALVGGALEKCVLDAVKKEKFPPQRGDDVVLDVPLSFKPGT